MQVVISTDDMGLAGDIIQDMAASLGVADLESKALFPGEMAAFEAVLGRVEEANATRLKLTADVADSLMTLKTMVVKVCRVQNMQTSLVLDFSLPALCEAQIPAGTHAGDGSL